jgi:hypothetical protein
MNGHFIKHIMRNFLIYADDLVLGYWNMRINDFLEIQLHDCDTKCQCTQIVMEKISQKTVTLKNQEMAGS